MISFTIPGAPRGKGRPRATRFGKGIRLYTDAKTASYEGLVALAAETALSGRAPLTGPLCVSVLVKLPVPASASKKAREAMLNGTQPPAKKPDLDNIVKAVLDGCNGVAFADDAQICWINAGKIYAERPGVDVIISLDLPAAAESDRQLEAA